MSAPAKAVVAKARLPIVIADQARIPDWIIDLESFRRWAHSDEFPEWGQFSYLDGELWVDPSMEQLFSHNLVKTEISAVLATLVRALGYFFSDRARLTTPEAGLSTEPDGLFAFWETVRIGRLRLVEGARGGYVELEGTPDMVLEILSRSSKRKDTVKLRELYGRARIPEYWLVDARGASPRFDIFRHTPKGYVTTRRQQGWLRSAVFGRAFQLTQGTDPLGHPRYTLAVRP
jgi:Uma2 family endonuclease